MDLKTAPFSSFRGIAEKVVLLVVIFRFLEFSHFPCC